MSLSSSGHNTRSTSLPSTSSASEPVDSEPYDYVEDNRILDCQTLCWAVGEIGVCSVCHSALTVKEDLVTRRGLVTKLTICCTNTACSREARLSDPYTLQSEHQVSFGDAGDLEEGETPRSFFVG